jgi:hypothetical protein
MKSKFKYGDKVLAGHHKGKVVSVRFVNSTYLCAVRFDDLKLIPREMEYEEFYLKFQHEWDEVCPSCGDRWNISKFRMHVWKDCLKCKKTQEELENG